MEASSGIDFGVSYFRHMIYANGAGERKAAEEKSVRCTLKYNTSTAVYLVDVIYSTGTVVAALQPQQCSSTYYCTAVHTYIIRIRDASTFLMQAQKTRSMVRRAELLQYNKRQT